MSDSAQFDGGGIEPNLNLGTLPIPSNSLWTWASPDPSYGVPLQVVGYPPGGVNQPTKTGLMPWDLQNFVGVQIQQFGNPIEKVPNSQIVQFIRWAEDRVERDTGVLLCQTWVAAPPLVAPGAASSMGIIPANSSYQVQGVDFDMYDAAYDFWFPRSQDAGWMNYTLRFKPVKSIVYDYSDYVAIKRYSFNYPLLNEFFRIPPSWMVVDEDMGMVRLVPSVNVQLLPLFALYLGFMAFTDSLPGGIQLQYNAGITPQDYSSRWSFMKQLVLAEAAITALSIIQGSINVGFENRNVALDGLKYDVKFDPKGAYNGLIQTFTKMRDMLLRTAIAKVQGPLVAFL